MTFLKNLSELFSNLLDMIIGYDFFPRFLFQMFTFKKPINIGLSIFNAHGNQLAKRVIPQNTVYHMVRLIQM